MNFKIIIAGLLTIVLAGCNNEGDPQAYLGYWTKAKYRHIALEITDQGNNHYLIKQLAAGFPPRQVLASMKDGELMIGGVEPVSILKDGSLFYAGREWVRMTDAEVETMKHKLTIPQQD
jgi:hypothetical protein